MERGQALVVVGIRSVDLLGGVEAKPTNLFVGETAASRFSNLCDFDALMLNGGDAMNVDALRYELECKPPAPTRPWSLSILLCHDLAGKILRFTVNMLLTGACRDRILLERSIGLDEVKVGSVSLVMSRPVLFIFAMLFGYIGTMRPAIAQESNYPDRPVRLIVPFAPGGGIDFLGRIVAQKLSQQLGQQFVVDNRAGAGGVVGTGMVANAAPDGHTLLLGFIGPLSISPNLEKVPYDPVRAFTAAGMLAATYHVLVVHTLVTARTVKELIALARAKPAMLSFASAGIGSPPHLVGQLFMTTVGIDVTHIPYKGSGPAAIGLLSGEAQMQFGSTTAVMPHIRSNRLAALAVTSPDRSGLLPEVPTLAESGVSGIDVKVWYALLAPATTPRSVTARLNRELVKLGAMPEYRNYLAKEALEPLTGGYENFSDFVKADIDKWAKVVRAAGIKVN